MDKRNNNKLIGISILRVLAIIGVVFYHINPRFMKGGFLGVNLFLVISGYLLVNSLEKSKEQGDINIFKEMGRRLRKIVPHLYLMISLVIIFLMVFNKPLLLSSRGDAIAGMTFTSNIWYILKKVSYFDAAAASPFKHLWYLGLQVQFYLAMIILYKLTSGIKIRKNLNLFFFIGLGLAVISLGTHVYLYNPDNVNRVYYGFDTRLFSPMVGVLGAYIFPLNKIRSQGLFSKRFNNRRYLWMISIIMILIFAVLNFMVADYSSWLYMGGFLLVDIYCLMMLVVLSSRFNSFVKYFNNGLIKILDTISYPLYIWHFPIIVLSMTQGEIRGPNPLYTIIRLLVCLVVAIFIDGIISKAINKNRRSLFKVLLHSLGFSRRSNKRKEASESRSKIGLIAKRAYLILFILGLAGFAFPWISSAFVVDNSFEMDDSYVAGAGQGVPVEKPPVNTIDSADQNQVQEGAQTEEDLGQASSQETDGEENQATDQNETQDQAVISPNLKSIVLIGDSIGLNVGPELKERFNNTVVDTAISRQLYRSYDIAEKYSSYDSPNNAVVFMLGTNGMFNRSHVDQITSYYPQSKLYFVNVYTTATHERELNRFLDQLASENNRINIVDWHSIASANPYILEPDATHIKVGHADLLVDEIIKVIKENQ